ncbi:MAG: cytochrome c biogenesis protein CcdA, partial [Sphingomonadales bacterium]
VRPRPGDGRLSFWAGDQNGARITWTLPAGFELGRAHWPAVSMIDAGAGQTYAFIPGATLVQEITAPESFVGGPVELSITLQAQVCNVTCRAESFTGAVSIGTGQTIEDTVGGPAIALLEADSIPFRRRHVSFRSTEGKLNLALTLDGFPNMKLVDVDSSILKTGFFLPITEGVLAEKGAMAMERTGQGVFGSSPLAAGYDPEMMVEGLFLALDAAGRQAYVRHIAEPSEQERAAEIKELEIVETGSGAGISFTFPTAILFALLGGIILNIMPCVFPVLAMKAFSLMKSSNATEAVMRRDGLAYTAGILVSFLAIGLLLVGLRAAGSLVGWGFQMQQPAFVLAMIIILFAVGLNFLGLYSVSHGRMGWGQGLTEKDGAGGAFATGVLAALVATPCTAPFMAPAIAYALGVGDAQGVSILLALGLGLALPYLAISFVPAFRRLLPKPGPWLETAREFLAFPIFATAIWLIWVFETETGSTGLLVALGSMLLLALAVWIGMKFAGAAGSRGALRRPLVSLIVLVAIAPVFLANDFPRPLTSAMGGMRTIGGMNVELYGPERLEEMQTRITDLRNEGKSVFLHFWASWCIICLTHENLVYKTDAFQDFLARNDIVFMAADNTLENEATISLMQVFGRSGQPLDVFFPGSGGNKAVVLPELFTKSTVMRYMRESLEEGGAAK